MFMFIFYLIYLCIYLFIYLCQSAFDLIDGLFIFFYFDLTIDFYYVKSKKLSSSFASHHLQTLKVSSRRAKNNVLISLLFSRRLHLAAAGRDAAEDKHNSSTDSFELFKAMLLPPTAKQRSHSVIKSASTSGLSVVIPASDFSDESPICGQSIEPPSGSSTAASRETLPCRELCGFEFTVHTIRVYYEDSDFYTMHHLVMVGKAKFNVFAFCAPFFK